MKAFLAWLALSVLAGAATFLLGLGIAAIDPLDSWLAVVFLPAAVWAALSFRRGWTLATNTGSPGARAFVALIFTGAALLSATAGLYGAVVIALINCNCLN